MTLFFLECETQLVLEEIQLLSNKIQELSHLFSDVSPVSNTNI